MNNYQRLDLDEREEISRVLAPLVERTSRATILIPVKNREAETVAKAFAKEVKELILTRYQGTR